jgi:hypothetical protein
MPISQSELATLFHNQLNHFEALKINHGIDFGMSNQNIYDMIKDIYTDSLQADVFTLHAMENPVSELAYIEATVPTSIKATEIPEMEIQLKRYSPQLEQIPLNISPDIISLLRDARELPKIGQLLHTVFDSLAITLTTQNIASSDILAFDTEAKCISKEDLAILEETLQSSTLEPAARREVIRVINASESRIHRAQDLLGAVSKCGEAMYDEFFRGGVSKILATPSASIYIQLNAQFTSTLKHRTDIGPNAHIVGQLTGVDVWKVSRGLADGSFLCIWKNENNPVDVSLAFNTLVPLYYDVVTNTFNVYGDYIAIQPSYIKRVSLINLQF